MTLEYNSLTLQPPSRGIEELQVFLVVWVERFGSYFKHTGEPDEHLGRRFGS